MLVFTLLCCLLVIADKMYQDQLLNLQFYTQLLLLQIPLEVSAEEQQLRDHTVFLQSMSRVALIQWWKYD